MQKESKEILEKHSLSLFYEENLKIEYLPYCV